MSQTSDQEELEELIQIYEFELSHCKLYKLAGQEVVPASHWPAIAAGRQEIPIDEVINRFKEGIDILKAGKIPDRNIYNTMGF